MARSSNKDPIEKFRFRLTVLSIDLSVSSLADSVAAFTSGNKNLGVLQRAGFSNITLPKLSINTMKYRENIDNPRRSKHAGLVDYQPITLKRGVTQSRDLYDWYRLVNEEMALLAVAGELSKDSKFSPTQSTRYRKDVVIEVIDRTGEPVKGWFLFNAFPTSYQGGDVLDATSNDKLLEELTLDYEFFLEFAGGVNGFAQELAKGAAITAAGTLTDALGISDLLGFGTNKNKDKGLKL